MKHPEAAIVPLMMIADYVLTVAGARRRDAGYASHFQTEHYELNPAFQKAIAARQWWNPRHLAATAITAAALVWLSEYGDPPAVFLDTLFGCLIVLYGAVIGRHLTNLLTFRRLERRPFDVQGQVTLSHDFMLSLSLYQTLGLVIPVALIAVFSPGDFARGGAWGIAALAAVHLVWRWRYARARRCLPASPPPLPPSASDAT